MVEKAACLLGPLDGTDSAVAVHCPGVGPARPGAARIDVKCECHLAHSCLLLKNDPTLSSPLPATHSWPNHSDLPTPSPHYRYLNRTRGRMLGLWLTPSRRGSRLRLVAMELCSMVWIGLVNSSCSKKEGDLVLSTPNGQRHTAQ